ncbi:hypothetical protein CDAR_497701 [Caerostris darwini]|uniref:Uncharacterized protein n=1 Tax=Caerostris darwini TaxID=1538125 RepID=A0AAV4PVA5_9ARAC|nr:hypothetical protein CDAR_497701 [Caerostris darwini]
MKRPHIQQETTFAATTSTTKQKTEKTKQGNKSPGRNTKKPSNDPCIRGSRNEWPPICLCPPFVYVSLVRFPQWAPLLKESSFAFSWSAPAKNVLFSSIFFWFCYTRPYILLSKWVGLE